MDGRPGFTDDEFRILLRVCRIYDLGIVASGLVAVAIGHVAGGLGVMGIGTSALLSGAILSRWDRDSNPTRGSMRSR